MYHLQVIGRPSQKLMNEMGEAEKERVKSQREMLGEEGLKQLAVKLENATEENEVRVFSK